MTYKEVVVTHKEIVMTYEEFCEGVGMKVDRKCYERIEAVYMSFDRFDSREAIYDFYKKHGMNGIETLYEKLVRFDKLLKQEWKLRWEINELQQTLNGVIERKNKVAILYGVHQMVRFAGLNEAI